MTSHAPFLLLIIVLIIPLVSSCLRTVNNPGDFVVRAQVAKIFVDPPSTDNSQNAKTGEAEVVAQTETPSTTPGATTTTAATTTTTTRATVVEVAADSEKNKHQGGGHVSNSPYFRTEAFKKHMEKYRGIIHARTYQAKTFPGRTEAGGDSRPYKSNESSSVGVSLQKPSKFETNEGWSLTETKEGSRGMCSTCPKVMISTTEHLKKQCDNWKAIEDNFLMNMDVETPEIKESFTVNECFKTITCPEPFAIVKWFDYSMCDVHNAPEEARVFDAKCNGTHWTMHGFPIDAVSCAKKRRL